MTFERSGAGRAFACAPRSKHKNETHPGNCKVGIFYDKM